MITLLTGSNRLAIEERLRALRAEYDPSGINTSVIENASQRLADVQAAAGAIGFFGATRVVVAHELLGRKSAGHRGRKADDDEAGLARLLGSVPPATVLILVEPSLDSASERAVRKHAPDVTIERFDVPRGRDLVEWSCARARIYRATLDPRAATELLEALFPGSWNAAARRDDVPPDLIRLDQELAKLATAAGPEQRVDTELVSALVPGAESQNIWGLTDAISRGEPAMAVQEAERALNHGVAPEALIGQLTGQFEALAALSLAGAGANLSAVAASSGLSEARLSQTARVLRHFPPGRLRFALTELRQFDADAKQGRIVPDDALASLVARLATPARHS